MAMLGVLVMTGIVSDSPINETQNKQDLCIENLTQNLGQIFTQTIANMETSMLSIVTQFEKIKESFTSQEVVSNEQSKQAKTEDEGIVVKVENLNDETQSQNITATNEACVEIGKAEQPVDAVLIEQETDVQEVKTSNLNVL